MTADLRPAYVTVTGHFDGPYESSFLATIEPLRGKISALWLLIGTIGGERRVADHLYTLLLGWPDPVITHAIGLNASAGISLLLAGSRRLATPEAMFGFHGNVLNPATLAPPGQYLTETMLEDCLRRVRTANRTLARQYLERCAFSDPAEVETLLGNLVSYPPEWALARGVIHEIAPVTIPRDALLLTVPTTTPTTAAA
jgi:ATP-dependent protease ClpP protease subunit